MNAGDSSGAEFVEKMIHELPAYPVSTEVGGEIDVQVGRVVFMYDVTAGEREMRRAEIDSGQPPRERIRECAAPDGAAKSGGKNPPRRETLEALCVHAAGNITADLVVLLGDERRFRLEIGVISRDNIFKERTVGEEPVTGLSFVRGLPRHPSHRRTIRWPVRSYMNIDVGHRISIHRLRDVALQTANPLFIF